MATANFQISTYQIRMGRELGIGSSTCYSLITCRGDDYTLHIYFLRPDSIDLDNVFWPDRKLARIAVPWDQFPMYVDVLRNEEPLYAYLYSDSPNWNSIRTYLEPVGEEEEH